MGYMQELAAIYTEGYTGYGVDQSRKVIGAATPVDGGGVTPSGGYAKGWSTAPSGMGQVTVDMTTQEQEEERQEPKRPIKHDELIDCINAEIHKAHDFGQDYTVMVLSQIKNTILGGRKNKS